VVGVVVAHLLLLVRLVVMVAVEKVEIHLVKAE